MQPYVIRQGDFLLSVAYAFGFDADTVWNDSSNDDLRKLRANPNALSPGDVLYIPDQSNKQPVLKDVAVGATNSFVSTPPSMTVAVKFVGEDPTTFASQAFTIQELEQLTGLVTNGDGVAKFDVPVTMTSVTVVFTDVAETYTVSIGTMDPVNTMSGVFKRLQNLGYIGSYSTFDARVPKNNLGLLRSALRTFKASQADGDDSAPSSAPTSDPPSSAASSPPDSSPSDGPPSSAASSPPDSSPSSAASSPPDSSPSDGPPSSAASSSSPDSAATGSNDDAGLDDKGGLDADTTALLVKVHGY
jgi:hypothetical protein